MSTHMVIWLIGSALSAIFVLYKEKADGGTITAGTVFVVTIASLIISWFFLFFILLDACVYGYGIFRRR